MINAAIVGLGWWGKILVESVQHSSSAMRFTTAVVRAPERHHDYAAHTSLALNESYDAVLGDPAIDAVVLATPHSQHRDQVIAAARAGKHVFCEKPLALTLADAQAAVDACRAAGVVLGLGNDKRFLPAMLALQGMVRDGTLGEIVHVEGQYSNANSSGPAAAAWRDDIRETPAGGMTGPGLHILDAMLHLAGPATRVSASFTQHAPPPDLVDSAVATYAFESGASGMLSTVRGVPEFLRFQVSGTKGWAEVRDFGKLTTHRAGGDRTVETYPAELAVGALLEHFAVAAAGGPAFPVFAAEMLRTIAALEATVASIASQSPVAVAAIETNASARS